MSLLSRMCPPPSNCPHFPIFRDRFKHLDPEATWQALLATVAAFLFFLGGGSGGAGLGELFFISGVPRALVVPRCRWDIYGFVSGRGGQAELMGAGEQGTGGACAEPRFLTDRLTNWSDSISAGTPPRGGPAYRGIQPQSSLLHSLSWGDKPVTLHGRLGGLAGRACRTGTAP